jgi:hypothetical protein
MSDYYKIGVAAPRGKKKLTHSRYVKCVNSAVNRLIKEIIECKSSKVEVITSLRPGLTMDITKGILYAFENDPEIGKKTVALTTYVPDMTDLKYSESIEIGYNMNPKQLEEYTLMEDISDAQVFDSHQYPDPEIIIIDSVDMLIMVNNVPDKRVLDWRRYIEGRYKNEPPFKLIKLNKGVRS